MEAVVVARKALNADSDRTAWEEFRQFLKPSILLWTGLWASYIIALECMMFYRFGGGNLIASSICIALVLGMLSACFVRAPRSRTLGALTLFAFVWAMAAFVISVSVTGVLMVIFGASGYMGLGLLFAPVVATLLLAAFAFTCWNRAVQKGDAWFTTA